MSDDTHPGVEVSAEQQRRWQAAAEADGLSLAEWIRWLANGRAAVLESRVEGAWPDWWKRYSSGNREADA